MIPTTEMIPGISGMKFRGLQKLDNNLARASYLFHLYCIFFTVCNLPFTALYFAVNCFFFGLLVQKMQFTYDVSYRHTVQHVLSN